MIATQNKPHASSNGVSAIGQHLVLARIAWNDYQTIGQILRDRPALRLTFDRGSLEIMTTSPEHEKYKMRLGRLVETLAEELGLRIEPGGNMTFQRVDLDKGLEADQCYWIQHEDQVRGKLAWDSNQDPPPDLVIEIEISRSALSRLSIYASLGVPEVWCFDGEGIKAFVLQTDRSYLPSLTSAAFTGFIVTDLTPYMQLTVDQDYLAVIKSFRTWLQTRVRKPG